MNAKPWPFEIESELPSRTAIAYCQWPAEAPATIHATFSDFAALGLDLSPWRCLESASFEPENSTANTSGSKQHARHSTDHRHFEHGPDDRIDGHQPVFRAGEDVQELGLSQAGRQTLRRIDRRDAARREAHRPDHLS